jgi:hypothetical protein
VNVAENTTPVQSDASATVTRVGVGPTLKVKVICAPAHTLAVGVTEMNATIGDVPALVGVKGAIFPDPDEARLIVISEFDHTYVVPDTGPEKPMAVVNTPLHNI